MNKSLIKTASRLFPKQVTSFAYKRLTNPYVKKLRENELATLDKANKEKLNFKGFEIQLYTWIGGPNEVLLVHGWEGQAGNFSDLIERLQKENYTIYAFDGPSHGFSSKGKTSLFEFTELVGILIEKFGVKSIVSHSFGGVATTYALKENQSFHIEKYALLTTPDRFVERIEDVINSLGITQKVKRNLISRLEKEINIDVETLNVSDFVKEVNVEKALIIHDRNDKVIPIERSKRVHDNWKAADFKEIEGTGHFSILRTPEVIDEVVKFLK